MFIPLAVKKLVTEETLFLLSFVRSTPLDALFCPRNYHPPPICYMIRGFL